jgi:hypothetical protein
MIANGELERIWKKVDVAYSKLLRTLQSSDSTATQEQNYEEHYRPDYQLPNSNRVEREETVMIKDT